jgi:hypothetical protein
MRRAEVIRAHSAQYLDPIRFARGTVVTLGERDTEWPDFIRVTTADGNSGWAAADWLQSLGDGKAEALRDYSAKEANLEVGDEVGFCWEYGGWCWVILNEAGSGWIPASHLIIAPDVPEPERTLEETADAWIKYRTAGAYENPAASDEFVWADIDAQWLIDADPERLWLLIQEIYRRPEARDHYGLLAASLLEDMLGRHGAAFIDRVEALAAVDKDFASLLSGVWQFTMTDDVWRRVQSAWYVEKTS